MNGWGPIPFSREWPYQQDLAFVPIAPLRGEDPGPTGGAVFGAENTAGYRLRAGRAITLNHHENQGPFPRAGE